MQLTIIILAAAAAISPSFAAPIGLGGLTNGIGGTSQIGSLGPLTKTLNTNSAVSSLPISTGNLGPINNPFSSLLAGTGNLANTNSASGSASSVVGGVIKDVPLPLRRRQLTGGLGSLGSVTGVASKLAGGLGGVGGVLGGAGGRPMMATTGGNSILGGLTN